MEEEEEEERNEAFPPMRSSTTHAVQLLHRGDFAVDEDNVKTRRLRVEVADEFLRLRAVRVGDEALDRDLHLERGRAAVEERDAGHLLLQIPRKRTLGRVAREHEAVGGVAAPLLEQAPTRPALQHPRRGEHHARLRVVEVAKRAEEANVVQLQPSLRPHHGLQLRAHVLDKALWRGEGEGDKERFEVAKKAGERTES